MSSISKGLKPPLVFAPIQGHPKQIFVLLHDDNANPDQLTALRQAVIHAFPQAVVVLPYGPIFTGGSTYHWFEQEGLTESNYIERVAQALPELVAYIQRVQAKFSLTGETTAVAGFGQGATIALEATLVQPNLAGRVLAFSGCYAQLPAQAPSATTLHFLHGANDDIVPTNVMKNMHAHLSDLGGDATLDIASTIGHELHNALIKQAIHRLQTCVPMRSWQTAISELNDVPKKTLH